MKGNAYVTRINAFYDFELDLCFELNFLVLQDHI